MPDNIVIGLMFTATAGAAVEGIKTLGSSVDGLKAKTDKATRQFKEIGEAIKKSAAAGKDVSSLNSQYVKLWGSIERAKVAAQGFQAAQDKISGHRAAIGGMWGEAMGTVGLGMSLAAPIKQAVDFESAIAGIKTMIPDATADQMKSLGGTLLGMSRTMPVSAVGLAEVAKNAGQLGIALNDIPDFTNIIAKVSTAFEMPANESAEYMAKMANVYDIPMEKMTRMGDVVAKLAAVGTATPAGIINATSRVGGEANLFGMSVEQVAAWTNTFIGLGEMPENVGTAMITMFTSLQTPTKEAEHTLKRLGISAKQLKKDIQQDANGTLEKLFDTIRKAPKGRQSEIMEGLFQKEAGARLAQLLNARAPKLLADSFAAMQSADGTMDRVFKEKAATTANQLALLKNNVTELGISIGSTLLPALNDSLKSIRPVVYSMIAWSKAHPDLVANIGKAAAGLLAFKAGSLGVSFVYHTLGTAVWSAVLPFRALKTAMAFGDMTKQFGLVGAAVKALQGGVATAGTAAIGEATEAAGTAAVQSTARFAGLRSMFGMLGRGAVVLGSTIAGLSWPVILVGALIVGAGLLIYKYWRPIKDFFIGFWKGLKIGIEPLGPIFKTAFEWWAPVFSKIGGALKPVIDWFKDLMGPIESSGEATQKFGEIVGYVVGSIVTWFTKDLPASIVRIVEEFGRLPGLFKRFGMDMMNGLIGGVMGKMAEVKDTIVGAGKSVTGWFSGVLGISSPSKVFMRFGGYLDEGLALGIGNSIGAVTGAVNRLSAAAVPKLPDLGGMVRGMVGKIPINSSSKGDVSGMMPSLPSLSSMVPKLPDLGGMMRQAIPMPKLPDLGGMAKQALSAPLRNLPPMPKLPNMRQAVNSAMHFSPTINVSGAVSGAANEVAGQVRGAVEEGFESFRKQMDRYTKEMGRRAFGGAGA